MTSACKRGGSEKREKWRRETSNFDLSSSGPSQEEEEEKEEEEEEEQEQEQEEEEEEEEEQEEEGQEEEENEDDINLHSQWTIRERNTDVYHRFTKCQLTH